MKNLKELRAFLDLPHTHFIFQEQVHGHSICRVTGDWLAQHAVGSDQTTTVAPACDALISHLEQVVLVARAADCQLIGLFDPKSTVRAVIHAGWRSTQQGLAYRTVQKLKSEYSVTPENIFALFSPSAGPCCYQVGEEFLDIVTQSQWLKPSHLVRMNPEKKNNHSPYTFDLWSANTEQLCMAGIPMDHILNPRLCTICHNDRFFSYRADRGLKGSHCLMLWNKTNDA